MKQFIAAARRGQAAVSNPADVTFMFDDHEMTAHAPTTGQLALYLARQGGSPVAAVSTLFDLLAAVLDQPDYDRIEAQLQKGMDVEVLVEIVQYLVEEWSARPTRPSSGSSASPSSTGVPSTARQPTEASTTSS